MAESYKLEITVDSTGAKTGSQQVETYTKKIEQGGNRATKAIDALNKAIKPLTVSARALSGMKVGFDERSLRALTANDKKLRELTSTVNSAADAIKGMRKEVDFLIKSVGKLTTEFKNLNKTLDTSLDKLDKINSKTKQYNNNSKSASKSTREFAMAVGALGTGLVGLELARLADNFTAIQNRIAVVTGETESLNNATRDLLAVSLDARTDLNATADVFSKLIRVNKDYGFAQEELLGIVTTVSKAVSMSGATAQGAQGAMIQFAQALAGDFKAAAQELNSIIEQTPALAETMAQGLVKIGEFSKLTAKDLKIMASEGRISTEQMLKGLQAMREEVDILFGSSLPLMSQGVEAVVNSLTVFVGEVGKATGITRGISEGLQDLAKIIASGEIDSHLNAIAVGATTLAGLSGAALLTWLISLTGPIGLVIAGVAALAAGITFLISEMGGLDVAFNRAELLFDSFITSTSDLINSGFTGLAENIFTFYIDTMSNIGTIVVDGATFILESLNTLGRNIGSALADRFIGSSFEASFKTLNLRLQVAAKEVEVFFLEISESIQRTIQDSINSLFDKFVVGYNKILDIFGRRQIETFGSGIVDFTSDDLMQISTARDELEKLSGALVAQKLATDELIESEKEDIQTREEWLEVEQDFLQAIKEDEKAHWELFKAQKGVAAGRKEAITLEKKELKALDKLLGKSDSSLALQKDLIAAWELLNKAVAAGVKLQDGTTLSLKKAEKVFSDYAMEMSGANKELKEMRDGYSGLLEELNPTLEVTKKLAAAERLLSLAVEDGKISLAQKTEFLEQYQNSLDGTTNKLKDLHENITDTFMDGFEAAMEGGENFRDWFDDLIKGIAMSALRNRIVIPIVTAVTGVNAQGQTTGGGIAGGASAGSIVSDVGTITSGISGSAGNAATGYAGQFAMSGAGQSLGLSTSASTMASQYGLTTGVAGSGTTLTAAGQGLQSFAGGAANAFTAGSLGGMAAGLFGLSNDNAVVDTAASTIGAAIGNYILPGIGGLIGGFLGSVVGGLFGGKPSDKAQLSQINLATDSIEIGGNEGKKFSQENRDAAAALGHSALAVTQALEVLSGSTLEDEYTIVVGDRDGIRLYDPHGSDDGFGGKLISESDPQVFVEKMVNLFADQLGVDVDSFSALRKEGEFLSDTILRTVNVSQILAPVLEKINISLGGLSKSSIAFTDALVESAGGLEALSSSLNFYYQNFFSEEERSAQVLDSALAQVTEMNEILGLTGDRVISTKSEFREYIESLDTSTSTSAEAVATALKYADSVAIVSDSLEQVITSTEDLINEERALVLERAATLAFTEELEAKALQDRVDAIKSFEDSEEAFQGLLHTLLKTGEASKSLDESLKRLQSDPRTSEISGNYATAVREAQVASDLSARISENALSLANAYDQLETLSVDRRMSLADPLTSGIQKAILDSLDLNSSLLNTSVTRAAFVAAKQQVRGQFSSGGPGLSGIAAARAESARVSRSGFVAGRGIQFGEDVIAYGDALVSLNLLLEEGTITVSQFTDAVDSVGEVLPEAVMLLGNTEAQLGRINSAQIAIGEAGVRSLEHYFNSLMEMSSELAASTEQSSNAINSVTSAIGRMNSFSKAFKESVAAIQLGVSSGLTYTGRLGEASLIAEAANIASGIITTQKGRDLSQSLANEEAFKGVSAEGLRSASLLLEGVSAFDVTALENTFIRLSAALADGSVTQQQFAVLFNKSLDVFEDTEKLESEANALQEESLSSVFDQFKKVAEAAESLADKLLLSADSTLSLGDKFAEAERQYSEVLLRARAGEAVTSSELSTATTSLLTAGGNTFSSRLEYSRLFANVVSDIREVETESDKRASEAEAQLEELRSLKKEIEDLRAESREGTAQVASNIAKTNRRLDEWAINGLPPTEGE